jgi:predicted MFS family arabinose efflux permease
VIISLNSAANQFGRAVGGSLAAVIIANSGIQNIILITIVASNVITMIQLYGRK